MRDECTDERARGKRAGAARQERRIRDERRRRVGGVGYNETEDNSTKGEPRGRARCCSCVCGTPVFQLRGPESRMPGENEREAKNESRRRRRSQKKRRGVWVRRKRRAGETARDVRANTRHRLESQKQRCEEEEENEEEEGEREGVKRAETMFVGV